MAPKGGTDDASTGIFEAHFSQQVSFAGHRSQVIVLPIQKISNTLLKANFKPKKCLA